MGVRNALLYVRWLARFIARQDYRLKESYLRNIGFQSRNKVKKDKMTMVSLRLYLTIDILPAWIQQQLCCASFSLRFSWKLICRYILTIELRWNDFVMTALASATGLPSPHSHPFGHGKVEDKSWEPLSDSSQSRTSHSWKKAFLLFACECCHTILRNKELLYSLPTSLPKASMEIATVSLN